MNRLGDKSEGFLKGKRKMTLRKVYVSAICAGLGLCLANTAVRASDAVTLAKAVDAAAAASKGTAIAAKSAAGAFEVHVVAGGKLQSVPVDAKGTASAGKDMPGEGSADIAKALTDGKQTLSGAIAAAEGHSKGKATMAKAWMNAGKLEFMVATMVGDKTMNVTVDGMGKATKMEEAKADAKAADPHKGHDHAKPAEKKP